MLITFSDTFTAPDWYSDPEATVKALAAKAGIWANVKHARGHDVRFTLHTGRWIVSAASSAKHDEVIRLLLELDPMAKVRTARAVYEGLDDYKAQLAARVP